jgi:peptidoglycan/LPS O-acetylase OafA/YrhL
MSKYPWLDWLRFLSAFIVMIGHIRLLLFPSLDSYILRIGNEAVIMFFVLSGYLVGGKAIERLRNDTFDLKNYIIDRGTRILVPLVPALGLTLLITLYIGNYENYHQLGAQVWKNNAVLWSLVYEIVFYTMVVVLYLAKKTRVFAIPGVIIFSLIFYKLHIHYLICWLLGAWVYLTPIRRNYIIVSIIMVIAGSILYQNDVGHPESSRLIIALGAALLIKQLTEINMSVYAKRAGERLAAASYTLYLVHFPVINYVTLKGCCLDVMLGFYVAAAWCFIATFIMYWTFEKNTDKIRTLIRNKIK